MVGSGSLTGSGRHSPGAPENGSGNNDTPGLRAPPPRPALPGVPAPGLAPSPFPLPPTGLSHAHIPNL